MDPQKQLLLLACLVGAALMVGGWLMRSRRIRNEHWLWRKRRLQRARFMLKGGGTLSTVCAVAIFVI